MTTSLPRRGLRLFTLIWLGNMVSALGSGLIGFALGVTVLQATGSVTRYALIALSSQLPGLLLSPLIGVVVDRFDRRKVLMLAGVGGALGNLLLYWAVRREPTDLWLIYPIITLTFCFTCFNVPAFLAATGQLVDKEHYGRASGMAQMGASVVSILSPALGGVVLLAMDLPGVVLINLVSYLVPVAILVGVRFPPPRASAEGAGARGTVAAEAGYGWRFVRERPGLLHLLLTFAAVTFFMVFVHVLLPPLVLSFATPLTLGLVLAVASSGTLVGGILMTVWGGPRRRRVATILGILLASGLILGLAGLRPNATLIATGAFFFVLGFPVIAGSSQAIWLSKVPQDVQGRVFAVRRMIVGGVSPLALALAGPLADGVFEPLMARGGALAASLGPLIGVGPGRGIALMYWLLSAGIVVTVVLALRSPALRRLERELPDADDAEREAGEGTSLGAPLETPRSQAATSPALGRLGAAPLLLLWAVVGLGPALSISLQRPPAPVPASAPAAAFSAERALADVEALAREPRPVGSPAHAEARDHLLRRLAEIGLEPRLQRTTVETWSGPLVQVVTVENVLARLPGRSPGEGRRGVLLVAHYDSAPSSPGACDNASAVAALLETARALAASPPLREDVFFLFSDAEEVNRGGAVAFVREHPWARRVATVVNLDARGCGGPVYLFQTGEDDGRRIEHFAAAAPRPLGSSLLAHVYRRLPNETDFSVFLEAGYGGFNLAFLEKLTHYHGMLDRPGELEPASLQHQGSYALSLARRFGELAEPPPAAGDRAYFSLLGSRMVSYPRWLALASALAVGLATLAVVAFGLRRGRLSSFGVVQGFLGTLGLAVSIPVALTLLWLAVRDLGGVETLMGSVAGAGRFLLGLCLLGVALFLVLHRLLRRVVPAADLLAGACLWWLLPTSLSSGLLLPADANFLFVWPLAGGLGVLAYLVRRPPGGDGAGSAWRSAGVLALGALPGVLLVPPFVALLHVGLRQMVELGGLALLPGVLWLALLGPQLETMLGRRAPAWAAALALGGVVSLGVGVAGPDVPRASSLLYTWDAESGDGRWWSFDPRPTPWTRGFGFEEGRREPFRRFYPALPGQHLRAPAPAPAELPPAIEVLAGERRRGAREYRLRLPTPPGGRARVLWLETGAEALSARLGGVALSLRTGGSRGALIQRTPLPADHEDLVLRLRGDGPVKVVVVDQVVGLPVLGSGLAPRPASETPKPLGTFVTSEVSLLRRTVTLPVPPSPPAIATEVEGGTPDPG